MRKVRPLLLVAFLTLVASSLFAQSEYKIDPAHSTAGFAVKHMMVSTVRGRFTEVGGTILYDEKDPSKSSVTATIKTASITTDNERRDGHLKSPDFFDVAKYPEITFKSTKVEKRGDQWVAIGDLTIKDVKKTIELPFSIAAAEVGGKKRIGVETATNVNRFDYHVSWDDPTHQVVSKDVKLEIALEAGAAQAAAAQAK